MDAKAAGIQMILGAAEILEQHGDESPAEKQYSEEETDSVDEEELAGDMGEPCFDGSDVEIHTPEHHSFEEQSLEGGMQGIHPRQQRRRLSHGDGERGQTHQDPKKAKAIALHNRKEQIRRKDLREAIHKLRNQLKRKTKKPATISVLKAAQHEIRELKVQEGEGQQKLDALTKKQNFLTWRLEKLVSEYKEGSFRSQVPLRMPSSLMCTGPVSPPNRQVGDSQMMLQMPKLPANTDGSLPAGAVTAFPPRYITVPPCAPTVLPGTTPFHFHSPTIPSPPLVGFPQLFTRMPSPHLQPPYLMPGPYFCAAPTAGRFGVPNRLLAPNSMYGYPPGAMSMLCPPQFPLFQEQGLQNMIDPKYDGSHRIQREAENTLEQHSRICGQEDGKSLGNLPRHFSVINYATSTANSSMPKTHLGNPSEDESITEEEEMIDVEQESPEDLQPQLEPFHSNTDVQQRSHHIQTTAGTEASPTGHVQLQSCSGGDGSITCCRGSKNCPDFTTACTASKKTRTSTSADRNRNGCSKNFQHVYPPRLRKTADIRGSILAAPTNFHASAYLPKKLPNPPMLKTAENDLVSRVMENIRPQRERVSKKVSDSALEKYSKAFTLPPKENDFHTHQTVFNSDYDSICNKKQKKDGPMTPLDTIGRVSTAQDHQPACIACS